MYTYIDDSVYPMVRGVLNLEGGLVFLEYVVNIEKTSLLYLSPVQKKHVVRKFKDLKAVLSS
jgi:hypothetical protein